MSAPRRTASKLLADAYSRLCASEDGYIGECVFDTWKASSSGEGVICDAFVSLEKAARSVTKTRRMTFSKLEEEDPDSIPSLFSTAIALTERNTIMERQL